MLSLGNSGGVFEVFWEDAGKFHANWFLTFSQVKDGRLDHLSNCSWHFGRSKAARVGFSTVDPKTAGKAARQQQRQQQQEHKHNNRNTSSSNSKSGSGSDRISRKKRWVLQQWEKWCKGGGPARDGLSPFCLRRRVFFCLFLITSTRFASTTGVGFIRCGLGICGPTPGSAQRKFGTDQTCRRPCPQARMWTRDTAFPRDAQRLHTPVSSPESVQSHIQRKSHNTTLWDSLLCHISSRETSDFRCVTIWSP